MAKKPASFDPYKTLKVRKNAGPEAIQRAYRERAREAHPDTGGVREQFEAVHLAYRVLTDPERRARYDATGEVDANPKIPDNKNAELMGTLAEAFSAVVNALMQKGRRVENENVVDHMRDYLDCGIQALRQNRQATAKVAGMLQESLERFEEGGESLLRTMVEAQLTVVQRQMAGLKEQEGRNAAAIAYLQRCKFKHKPLDTGFMRGGFGGYTTASGS